MGVGWLAPQGITFDLGRRDFHVWSLPLPSLVRGRIVPEVQFKRTQHHVVLGPVPRIIGRVFVQWPSLDLRTIALEPSHHPNDSWLRTDVTRLHIDTTGGLGGSTVCILLRIPVDH